MHMCVCRHLSTEHALSPMTRAQAKVQVLVVEQLQKQVIVGCGCGCGRGLTGMTLVRIAGAGK